MTTKLTPEVLNSESWQAMVESSHCQMNTANGRRPWTQVELATQRQSERIMNMVREAKDLQTLKDVTEETR